MRPSLSGCKHERLWLSGVRIYFWFYGFRWVCVLLRWWHPAAGLPCLSCFPPDVGVPQTQTSPCDGWTRTLRTNPAWLRPLWHGFFCFFSLLCFSAWTSCPWVLWGSFWCVHSVCRADLLACYMDVRKFSLLLAPTSVVSVGQVPPDHSSLKLPAAIWTNSRKLTCICVLGSRTLDV